MIKIKCLTSDDHSAFIPGEVYDYNPDEECSTGLDGWDWYLMPLGDGVMVLCGLDETSFEVLP